MEDAGLYKYMQDNHSIHSKIILNHIRYMAGGEQKYENTHPFVRELFGQDWALIHNGARGIDNFFGSYLEQNPQIDFVPLGTTGSEKALCIILNEIKKRVPSRISTAQNGGNLRVYTDYEFSEVEQVVYETCVDIQESGANLNILLSNGDHLIAFHSGYNKLHYTIRDGSRLDPGKIKLTARARNYFESIKQLPTGLTKQANEKAVIVATEILTDGEDWRSFHKGEFLVIRDGEIVSRRLNGSKKEQQWSKRIEVYDTPARLDNLHTKVIGMPQKLRKKLGVELGDQVKIRRNGADSYLELTVHQTDHRLLNSGECQADDPDNHVCIPREIRDALGLGNVESGHRNSLPAFTQKFTPVDISK